MFQTRLSAGHKNLFEDTNTLMMIGTAALLAVIAIGLYVGGFFNKTEEHVPDLEQYVGAQHDLNEVEANAAEYLRRVLGPEVHICPKVAIADIQAIVDLGKHKNWKEIYQSLEGKTLDFLVIDPNLQIHFGIMFDKRNAANPYFSSETKDLNVIFKHGDVNLIHVLPRKLERSDHLEFAAKQTISRPVIRHVA